MQKTLMIILALAAGCARTQAPAPETAEKKDTKKAPPAKAPPAAAPAQDDRARILARLEQLAATEAHLKGISLAKVKDDRLVFEFGRSMGPNPAYEKLLAEYKAEIKRRAEAARKDERRAKQQYLAPPEKQVEWWKPLGIYLEMTFYPTAAATPSAFIEAAEAEYRKEVRACANCAPRPVAAHAALGLYELDGVLHGKVGKQGFSLVMRGSEGWEQVRKRLLDALAELAK